MTKYLLQQPEKLETLAIDKLAAWIALQAKKFSTPIWELRRLYNAAESEAALSRQIEIIRNNFYSNMPKEFHNTMVSKTIKELLYLLEKTKHDKSGRISDSQTKVIGRMGETLFTENLTSLSLTVSLYTMLRESLGSGSHMLTGLIRLDLNFEMSPDIRLKGDIEFEFIQLLENLYSLKYLTINYVCTDNILRCIVKNCNLIEELNVYSSFKVNDISIDILIQLHKLRSINLGKTSVRRKGIEKLLLCCKEIEHIVFNAHDDTDRMPYVLKQIAQSKEKFPEFFKITTYRSDNDTFEELELVHQMCPLIRNLSIQAPFTTQDNNIMAITGLQGLRELTLERYGFYIHHLKEALKEIGRNLVHLRLLGVEQIDLNALVNISQTCPNLQSLSLENCTFIDQISPYNDSGIPLFRNLKKLILNSSSRFHVTYRRQVVPARHIAQSTNYQILKVIHKTAIFLLSNCLKVEFIHICRSSWPTEDMMLKVLDENPFTYLKELKIIQPRFYPPSESETLRMTLLIDRIIQNCINCPRVHLLYA